MKMWCGPCGDPFPGYRELRAHVETCARSDPWRAYFRARTRKEARKIMIDHLGATPPKPMSQDTKERLKALQRDPAYREKARRRREHRRAIARSLKRGLRRRRRA